VDLLTFVLELRTTSVAPFIIDTLLSTVQSTCVLVTIPRFQRESATGYEGDVDVTACLTLLHLTALGCVGEREHMIRFWKQMRPDFVLMMLSARQPLEDLLLMMRLLSTSALRDSIGPIAADDDAQNRQVGGIIDRITFLLFEISLAQENDPPHDKMTLSNLQLQILGLLDSFCRTQYGGQAIANHPSAIGRLVRLMSDELDAVYDHRAGHKKR
jgi:hypothetical protein